MTSFADTRVDICLYFIAPHALLPTDIATIERLGSMVPIVPIIAKVPLSPSSLLAMPQVLSRVCTKLGSMYPARRWHGTQPYLEGTLSS